MTYRNKGGRFRSCDDINDIFNMDDAQKKELIPYCTIKLITVDINKADTTQLKELSGIGSLTAKSLIDYRDRLGGFLYKEQLLEPWGLSEDLLEKLDKQIIITGEVNPLNINGESEPIFKHPYIEYQVAKVLIKYRNQHGDFKDISDIKKTRIISDSTYNRLAPYLSLN